jgi:hypothetical protein
VVILLCLIVLSIGADPGWGALVHSESSSNLYAAQQNQNSISGHVSDDHRRPIPDLRVELLNEVESVLLATKTDGSGLFVFRKLSDGTFHVRVLTYGTNYVSQTARVEIVRPLGFGALLEQVDLVLKSNVPVGNGSITGVLFAQEVPEPARKQYERGASQLKKGAQQSEGIAALQKAIEIFPQYFDALELLGTEYVKQQRYEEAVPILGKAVQVNPRAQASLFALAVGQYHLRQLPAALEALRSSISLNPKSINSQLWLGIVLKALGQLEEAETSFKKANELAESKVPEPHWQLALLFNQLKRYSEAADELELFLKVEPDARDVVLIRKLIKRLRDQARAKSTGTQSPQFSATATQP